MNRKFITLHTPYDEISINVDNITEMHKLTTLTYVGLTGGGHTEVNESMDKIMSMIESLDSELPVGEFTGGEPIPDVEESDYRKECNAMPGTSFKFGDLEFLESGFPLLQLLYTNKNGEQKESWIGPFRKYDFSVGPKSDIGCGPSSPQMHFECLKPLNSECRSAIIQAFASAAVCNWCATYEIVPNHQTRINWSENKWRDFIKECHKYIFDEESPLL